MQKDEQRDQDLRPDPIDEDAETQESFAEPPDETPDVANDEEEQVVS